MAVNSGEMAEKIIQWAEEAHGAGHKYVQHKRQDAKR